MVTRGERGRRAGPLNSKLRDTHRASCMRSVQRGRLPRASLLTPALGAALRRPQGLRFRFSNTSAPAASSESPAGSGTLTYENDLKSDSF